MDYPTSIPLTKIYGLIERKVRISDIKRPEGSFWGDRYKPVQENEDVPSAGKLNSLFGEHMVVEAFRKLANLPMGFLVILQIPPEHHTNFNPAGHYGFIVGKPEHWKYQLLVIAQAQEFLQHIATAPSSIIDVAKLAQVIGTVPREMNLLLHPIEEATVQVNAVLVALAYQFNAYGVAHISHPLTPDKVIFLATGCTIEVPTDKKSNNLWWFIAQRRALNSAFDTAINTVHVDITSRMPVIQQIDDNVQIEYPALLEEIPSAGGKLFSLAEKLCVFAKQYHSEVVRGIRNNLPYDSKIDKIAKKIESLKRQIEQERGRIDHENQ